MKVKLIKEELLMQKSLKEKDNLYYFSQVNFAYNSNRIEGSIISEEETKKIFETELDGTITYSKGDDFIETSNHFKLFDYMLDTLDDKLSKEMIIKMNVILKSNTSFESDPKYNVGGFKKYENIIGLVNVINTTKPEDVECDIDELLNWYNSLNNITIEDIIEFHYRFETIHPFGDGNGRIGRIIIFKECLRNNIMPCIILDSDKPFYMRGLQQYKNDKLFLIDTVKNEQDIYEKVSNELLDMN